MNVWKVLGIAAVGALVFLVVQYLWHNKAGVPVPQASTTTTTTLPTTDVSVTVDKDLAPLSLSPQTLLVTGMGGKKVF